MRKLFFVPLGVFILLLTPFRVSHLKDGGTVIYQGALYSVTRYHRLTDTVDGYLEGTKVCVCGLTVYDSAGHGNQY